MIITPLAPALLRGAQETESTAHDLRPGMDVINDFFLEAAVALAGDPRSVGVAG